MALIDNGLCFITFDAQFLCQLHRLAVILDIRQ
jgi:hypothetical protein